MKGAVSSSNKAYDAAESKKASCSTKTSYQESNHMAAFFIKISIFSSGIQDGKLISLHFTCL